ncbi:hypothetical protein EJB05_57491, partial [Eragrostis curvula]
MDFQKDTLRRVLFFLFEMSLAAALTVLVVFALANIGRSSDMLTKGNYTKIGVQSPEDIVPKDPDQERVLELGYNFLFTGFYHVKATSRTVEKLRRWRAARARFPPDHENTVFNHVKRGLAAVLGARMHPVPRHGALRWILPVLPQRHRRGVHGARELLRRAREQAARPKGVTERIDMASQGKQNGLNHLGSFLLGALLPTLLLLFLASDRVGERLSSFGNGYLLKSSAQEQANLTAIDGSAPAGQEEDKFPGLAELLPQVATEDGTVIITSVNEAWARPDSLLDLFRESFRNGEGIAHLLNHTLIVAVDAAGFDRCRAVHPYCYLLEVRTANVSGANGFLTKGYLELVWTKLSLQQRVLELGYNYLFTDVDVMWLRDPFRHVNLYADVTMSTDHFVGDPESLKNWPNTGFFYVKSTNRTVEMLRYWRAARSRFPPHHDQKIFDNIKGELVGKLGVRIEFLDTALFRSFCEFHGGEMGPRMCTIHANCCFGLENKVHDLKNVVADWKNYTSLSPAEKRSGKVKLKWRFPAKSNMGLGFGGKEGSHVVSFLLGAALPTALLFFLASDRLGEGLSSISVSWRNGTVLPLAGAPAQKPTNLTGEGAAPTPDQEVGFAGLAELLPKVAMEDRTVIITSVNEAWARNNSLLDLYLESFKNGEDIAPLLNHVLVVALDPAGFEHCKAKHPHCYLLVNVTSANLGSAKRYMSRDYLELVWTKLTFQQRVLELGYNFLFTDADMILFRNPLRHIPVYADMSCSSDDFKPTRKPLDNPLNTGLYYMKSTNRTIAMVRYWRAARARFPGRHDQQVFVAIKRELIRELNVTIEPLETVYFGGFCEYHDDPERICTMHADCCIGLETKVHDLKDIAADWKNYTSMAPQERRKGNFTWTVPVSCRRTTRWRKP